MLAESYPILSRSPDTYSFCEYKSTPLETVFGGQYVD